MVAVEKLGQVHDKVDARNTGQNVSTIHAWMDAQRDFFARRWPFGHDWVIIFTVATLVVAFVMFWHHDRVIKREQKYLVLLGSLREITEAATRLVISPNEPKGSKVFVGTALQVLAEATAKLRGQTSAKGGRLEKGAPLCGRSADRTMPRSCRP